MLDQAPEDILRAEEGAEHRQLEAESLIEAARDREMFAQDSGDPYADWGDYELDVWENTDTIDSDLDAWVSYIEEGTDALVFDTKTERRDRDGSLGGFNHAECQTTTCRCYLRGWSDGYDDGIYSEDYQHQPQERD